MTAGSFVSRGCENQETVAISTNINNCNRVDNNNRNLMMDVSRVPQVKIVLLAVKGPSFLKQCGFVRSVNLMKA